MRRRDIMRAALAALALAMVGPRAEGAEKIKLLFFRGGGIHDWKGLSPILVDVLNKTGDFEVTLTENLDDLKAESIKNYRVALFYCTGLNFADPAQEKGLCDFVRNGGAYAGIHSASDSFKGSDAYWELLGGRFVLHPVDAVFPDTPWAGVRMLIEAWEKHR